MRFRVKDLATTLEPLYGFSGESTVPMGIINLPITVGTSPQQSTIQARWAVVDSPSPFNAILGRPTLSALRVVSSIYHLCMKFPTPNEIGKVKGSQYDTRTCYTDAVRIG